MAVKTINISLDEKLIKEIDKAAKGEYGSRSDYIRVSLLKNLRSQPNSESQLDREYKKFVAQYGQTLKNLSKRWFAT